MSGRGGDAGVDPDEERLTAYHEAGHAVAAYLLHRAFRWVTVRVAPDAGPHVEFTDSREAVYARLPDCIAPFRGRRGSARDRALIRRWLAVPAAGPAAEERLTGVWNHLSALHDEREIRRMACYLTPVPERGEWPVQQWYDWVDRARDDARALWRNPVYWAAVEALAGRLLAERCLGSARARAVIGDAITRAGGRPPRTPRSLTKERPGSAERASSIAASADRQAEAGGCTT